MSLLRGPFPGEYLELATPVHRAPAWLKAAALLVLLLVSGFVRPVAVLAAVAAFALLVALVARMPPAHFRALAWSLLFFAVMSAGATLLLGGADGPWIPHSTAAALLRLVSAARATLRAAIALTLVGVFTFTTAPERLVGDLGAFRRRRRHDAPRAGGFALAVMIGLRMAPLLAEEFLRLRRAREARGARLDRGPWRARLADLGALFASYLDALLKRVDELSLALEARGYRS